MKKKKKGKNFLLHFSLLLCAWNIFDFLLQTLFLLQNLVEMCIKSALIPHTGFHSIYNLNSVKYKKIPSLCPFSIIRHFYIYLNFAYKFSFFFLFKKHTISLFNHFHKDKNTTSHYLYVYKIESR